jgi:hypothetical protein
MLIARKETSLMSRMKGITCAKTNLKEFPIVISIPPAKWATAKAPQAGYWQSNLHTWPGEATWWPPCERTKSWSVRRLLCVLIPASLRSRSSCELFACHRSEIHVLGWNLGSEPGRSGWYISWFYSLNPGGTWHSFHVISILICFLIWNSWGWSPIGSTRHCGYQ